MSAIISTAELSELRSMLIDSADSLSLKKVQIELRREFSSDFESHRKNIRLALVETIEAEAREREEYVNDEDLSQLLDLAGPPRHPNWNISIAHCPTLGGFILTAKQGRETIGLDFEITDRVSALVAKRVLPHASEKSLSQFVGTELLYAPATVWAAKESAIKCFGHMFPEHATNYGNVEITKWLIHDSSKTGFQARHENELCEGLAFRSGLLTAAISVSNPGSST